MNNCQLLRAKANLLLFLIPLILYITSCANKPEETLKQLAEEVQRTSPRIIDEYTTMTGCEVLENRTLRFTYVVKGVSNNVQKQDMEAAMKIVLLDRLKQRKELEFYQVNNVRFEHLFMNEQGKNVMHVNIEALDYK